MFCLGSFGTHFLFLCSYWYGKTGSGGSHAFYSFVHTSDLVPYETAVEEKMDQIPARIVKKLDQGQRLNGDMKTIVEGLKEGKEELVKDPIDRSGWVGRDFTEEYATGSGNYGPPSNMPPVARRKRSLRLKEKNATSDEKSKEGTREFYLTRVFHQKRKPK